MGKNLGAVRPLTSSCFIRYLARRGTQTIRIFAEGSKSTVLETIVDLTPPKNDQRASIVRYVTGVNSQMDGEVCVAQTTNSESRDA